MPAKKKWVYKPQPIQKPRLNMGMGIDIPSPENINFGSVKNAIDPRSIAWNHMGQGNQLKMFRALVKATNERMKQLRRNGMTDAPVYRDLISKGKIVEPSGAAGFSTKGASKWTVSKLKSMTEEVWNAYKDATSSSNRKTYNKNKRIREQKQEENRRNLAASIGYDYDKLMENQEENKELLTQFWNLLEEAEELGLWELYGLNSFDAKGILIEYIKDSKRRLPLSMSGVHSVALRALNKSIDLISGSAKASTQRGFDESLREGLLTDSDRLQGNVDSLLRKIGEHIYGTKPVEKSFESLKDETPASTGKSLYDMLDDSKDEEWYL